MVFEHAPNVVVMMLFAVVVCTDLLNMIFFNIHVHHEECRLHGEINIIVNTLHTGSTVKHYADSKIIMSHIMRKPTFWFPNWSDTNHDVQLQKMARGLKFWI